jgi:transglutaminase-like putative cysteine protease
MRLRHLWLLAAATASGLAPAADSPAPAERAFVFRYAAEVTGLPPGRPVRVWVPVPPSNREQTVSVLERDAPGASRLTREKEYGNEIWYVEATPAADGTIKLRATYKVARREVTPANAEGGDVERCLKPDSLVPVGGKPLKLIAGKELPAEPRARARALFDVVADHMSYSKEAPGWGRGDAAWACDSRSGNCTDFHSLFIALARSEKLPARFEVGFGLPPEKTGEVSSYHCWAKVKAGDVWLPVDVSEPKKLGLRRDDYFGRLPPNRVAFSTGRDIALEPRQDGVPLNFFIDPYAEVGGKPHPADKVKTSHSFANE